MRDAEQNKGDWSGPPTPRENYLEAENERLEADSIRLKRRVGELEAFMRTRVKEDCDCWHCRGFRAALSPQEKP
jgi:hypothetical protein